MEHLSRYNLRKITKIDGHTADRELFLPYGRMCGVAEVKCRHDPDGKGDYTVEWFEAHETYRISKKKWLACEQRARELHGPFLLIVVTSDMELFYWKARAPFPWYEEMLGGRRDRNDPKDTEMMVEVPWADFVHLDG